jgi:predicted transposase/invertase (TIGR01784 family)
MAYETLGNMSASKEEKLRLEYDIIARADHLAVVNCKAKTARAEGRAEGEQIGIAKGEHAKAIEVAKRMLRRGRSTIEEISEDTGLSIEEIKKLSN